MAKQLMFDEEARRSIQRGVQKLAQAVKITMGPTGKNVMLQKSFGGPKVTKDGVTVSKEVELKDLDDDVFRTAQSLGIDISRPERPDLDPITI